MRVNFQRSGTLISKKRSYSYYQLLYITIKEEEGAIDDGYLVSTVFYTNWTKTRHMLLEGN